MYLLLLLFPGQCKAGRAPFWGLPREGATCLAVGLMAAFVAFATSLPVQRGSRSFLGSSGKGATCLAQGGSRFGGFAVGKAATCFAAPRVAKMSKNESSQNEVLYIGKCSHTSGEGF